MTAPVDFTLILVGKHPLDTTAAIRVVVDLRGNTGAETTISSDVPLIA
jgi:hypothetical protein